MQVDNITIMLYQNIDENEKLKRKLNQEEQRNLTLVMTMSNSSIRKLTSFPARLTVPFPQTML